MSVYVRFLFDFMSQLFRGILSIVNGFIKGIAQIFNIPEYINVLKDYSNEFSAWQWILAGVAILVVLALMGFLIFLVFLLFKKYFRLRKSLVEQEALLEEIGALNRDVLKLTQEKERLYAMKVSQLGLKPGEDSEIEVTYDEDGNPIYNTEEDVNKGESRFFRLTKVDEEIKDYQPVETNNALTLEEICESFRNFAASKMGLYYKIKIVRLFLAAFSSTRLIILQGISGTGKTSMPYAWGKFLDNDATIASVQPSWRDRTELFGYFNEFTKKFNETEVLKKMYEATYKDIIYLTILDEMNIARVEYYFAEMLSILEMPSRSEWIIDLVPTVWDNDPIDLKAKSGKLKIPDNMWYIGTINNDDSTFMVTDKVYDRAIPININDKGTKFEAPVTNPIHLSFQHLESLFLAAKEKFPVSEETMNKLEEMDNYVIEHFRLAFGNRIVKQIHDFIPAYVSCGGTELEALDYIIANKILRKFEQLNLAFIRGEIDGFVSYLDKTFGKDIMVECKDFLFRLKKSM